MRFQSNDDLQVLLHPLSLVLKEGKKIKDNFLDYSLMMVFAKPVERIPSPKSESFDSSQAPKKRSKGKVNHKQG